VDKQTLIQELKDHVGGGGFINHSQIAKYIRRSRDVVPEMVRGLSVFQTGREKKYFIREVAPRILELPGDDYITKQSLTRDIKAFVGGGGLINQTQIAKYIGRSRGAVPELVEGLDVFPTKKAKRYFIDDVAARILDRRG